jgi:hypothetical protein
MPLSYDIKEHTLIIMRYTCCFYSYDFFIFWIKLKHSLIEVTQSINLDISTYLAWTSMRQTPINQSTINRLTKLSYVPEMLHMHINWRVSDMNKYWLCATQIINQYCNKGTHDCQTNNKCLIWRDAYNLAKRKKSHVNFHNTCAHFC